MHCSSCGTDNAAGARFCNQCVAPLGKRCLKCASDNAAEARFCSQCAAPLDSTAALVLPQAHPREAPIGERRHLTVLFCDLVGSTGIAAQLDPEEWPETVGGYHRAAAEAITRFGGYVAKCSEQASFVTGIDILVHGGMTNALMREMRGAS